MANGCECALLMAHSKSVLERELLSACAGKQV